MEYLVMECSPGYCVVLDSNGRFLKVPNLGYEVGQVIDEAVVFDSSPVSASKPVSVFRRLVSAACLVFVLLGGWGFWQRPVGRVRLQINPDVLLSVNYFDRVVRIRPLNEDGEKLLGSYHAYAKPLRTVSDEIADRAVEMKYLEENGQITLTIVSENKNWKTTAETLLFEELSRHLKEKNIRIFLSEETGEGSLKETDTNTNIQFPPQTGTKSDTPESRKQENRQDYNGERKEIETDDDSDDDLDDADDDTDNSSDNDSDDDKDKPDEEDKEDEDGKEFSEDRDD